MRYLCWETMEDEGSKIKDEGLAPLPCNPIGVGIGIATALGNRPRPSRHCVKIVDSDTDPDTDSELICAELP